MRGEKQCENTRVKDKKWRECKREMKSERDTGELEKEKMNKRNSGRISMRGKWEEKRGERENRRKIMSALHSLASLSQNWTHLAADMTPYVTCPHSLLWLNEIQTYEIQ